MPTPGAERSEIAQKRRDPCYAKGGKNAVQVSKSCPQRSKFYFSKANDAKFCVKKIKWIFNFPELKGVQTFVGLLQSDESVRPRLVLCSGAVFHPSPGLFRSGAGLQL